MRNNEKLEIMKLSKIKFLDASNGQELTKEEQKMILGGYASNCCFYVDKGGSYHCTSSAGSAEDNATGKYGTWACGTEEAKNRCGC